MKKSEAVHQARQIVMEMLGGRCCPETEDVADVTSDEQEQQQIINEINAILDRLRNQLVKAEQKRRG